jgi:hypothetical protein
MLKVIVKSLDDLDEAIKALYAEITLADGSTAYQLKLQGLNDHSEVISLKNAHEAQKVINRELRTKKEAAEARLDGLPEDFDANAYDTLKAQADAVPGKPDPAIIEAQIVDRVNRATKKLNDDNETLKSDKQKLIDQRNNSHRDIELNEQLAHLPRQPRRCCDKTCMSSKMMTVACRYWPKIQSWESIGLHLNLSRIGRSRTKVNPLSARGITPVAALPVAAAVAPIK